MIKYRIWDENKKSFIKNGTVDGSGWIHIGSSQRSLMIQKSHIVQQWTGLKDKNGVDIYEGDVVLDEHRWEITTVVKGKDLPSFFLSNINGALKFPDETLASTDLKVIGTIFGLNGMPCKPDHNGECLICDCDISACHLHEHWKPANETTDSTR